MFFFRIQIYFPYLSDDTLDVAVALGEVERPQLRGSLAVLRVRLEDAACALALHANATTHVLLKHISLDI